MRVAPREALVDSQPLPAEHRQKVLAAVWGALRAREPALFDQGCIRQPGGIMVLDQHLDKLVDMSRSVTIDRIEPYLVRIIDDICARCPQQGGSGYCELRHAGACVLFAHGRLIREIINGMLRDMSDPAYLAMRQGQDAGN
jgi:hypothetical protein